MTRWQGWYAPQCDRALISPYPAAAAGAIGAAELPRCAGLEDDHAAPACASGLEPSMRVGCVFRRVGRGNSQGDQPVLGLLPQAVEQVGPLVVADARGAVEGGVRPFAAPATPRRERPAPPTPQTVPPCPDPCPLTCSRRRIRKSNPRTPNPRSPRQPSQRAWQILPVPTRPEACARTPEVHRAYPPAPTQTQCWLARIQP